MDQSRSLIKNSRKIFYISWTDLGHPIKKFKQKFIVTQKQKPLKSLIFRGPTWAT